MIYLAHATKTMGEWEILKFGGGASYSSLAPMA